MIATANPFDLTGVEFLKFYWIIAAAIFVALLILRWMLRRSNATVQGRGELDAYELAYLAGGPRRVALAAVSNLCSRRQLAITTDGQVQTAVHDATGRNGVENGILSTAAVATPAHALSNAIRPQLDAVQNTLESQGLLVTSSARRAAQFLGVMIVAALLLVGAYKCYVGVQRDKPISFLVISMIATGIGGLALAARQPFRSVAGDELLARKRQDAPLSPTPELPTYQGGVDPMMMGLGMLVALHGLPALAGTPEYEQYKRMSQSVGGDVSSGSSCGSSSCGSSSSDGGGSDGGGGGCGGCGGGGD